MLDFKVNIPTKLLFGAGAIKRLHQEGFPGKKALVVTSAGKSVIKYGILDKLLEELKLAGVEYVIFNKILSNPILTHVHEGAEIARKEGCDFVVGLGGGSSIDAAKAIAISTTNEGNYWDYMQEGSGKCKEVTEKPLKIVAITTTAGTGTEVNPWTVTTNRELNEKICFGTDDTYPAIAVVDPELMVSVPSTFTAYQGFDALFHSTECYISKGASPYSEMLNLEAIKAIGTNLGKAVHNGDDIHARYFVALGNTLSGMSDSISSGISAHSIAHSIGGLHPETPHGAALIMICEAYYQFYADKHACDDKMIFMARAMGKTDANKPQDFVDMLAQLKKECGVDGLKLSDYGVTPKEFELIAYHARKDSGGLYDYDPCTFTDEDAIEVLQKSYR